MKKIPTRLEELPAGKIRGGQVHISAFIDVSIYLSIIRYANEDIGKWESELIRRILREWLEMKKTIQQPGVGSAGAPAPVDVTGPYEGHHPTAAEQAEAERERKRQRRQK